jgi:hypothetical protein
MPTQNHGIESQSFKIAGVSTMKTLSILVPAAIAGILASAMVLAAPQTDTQKLTVAKAPDRAEAYRIAMAD